MSDGTYPGFVYTQDMLAQAAATEKFVATELKKVRRANVGWRLYSFGTTVLVVLLVSSLTYALPLVRLVPVYFSVRPDGVTETAITTDSLPDTLSDATIQAWLWQYVMHREGYSWIESDYNHYVVAAMSSVPVRDAYDAWFQGKNPQSYMNVYGRRGVIRVGLREVTQWQRPTESAPGKITMHFDRMVAVEGEPRKPPQTWTVTLEFLQDYRIGINVRDALTFNPLRIVVTDYPGAQSLPATPVGISTQ